MGKTGRDAFLYMEPEGAEDKGDFAQCADCRLYVGKAYLKDKDEGRCVIHGSKIAVSPDATCGLFIVWPGGKPDADAIKNHAAQLDDGLAASVTPEESGLIAERVQCRRCDHVYQKNKKCGLFETLTKKLPEVFDLDSKVSPNGCCNAWKKKQKADWYR